MLKQLGCKKKEENALDRCSVKTAVTYFLAYSTVKLLDCWLSKPEVLGSNVSHLSILKYFNYTIYRIEGYFRIKIVRTSVEISISVVIFSKSVYFDGFIFKVGIYFESCMSYLNATIL